MAKVGRRPLSKQVLHLRGSWRGKTPDVREAGALSPRPRRVSRPKAPGWLSEAARQLWRRLAPAVEALDGREPLATHLFTRYCVALARWTEAQQVLQQHGLLCTTATGYQYLHPYGKLVKELGQELLRLEQELGITPASRQALGYPTTPPRGRKSAPGTPATTAKARFFGSGE